jgi:hypothetical protein
VLVVIDILKTKLIEHSKSYSSTIHILYFDKICLLYNIHGELHVCIPYIFFHEEAST